MIDRPIIALVRPGLKADERSRIESFGVASVPVDPADVSAMGAACAGAACVVSALNGLREVMVDRQGVLLDAAAQVGVPRFISSDFSADFTKTIPGQNRNFDLRREFMAMADRASINVTSILNGAFLDMLGHELPIIQRRIHRVLYWKDADQLLDFTTKGQVQNAGSSASRCVHVTDHRFALRAPQMAGPKKKLRLRCLNHSWHASAFPFVAIAARQLVLPYGTTAQTSTARFCSGRLLSSSSVLPMATVWMTLRTAALCLSTLPMVSARSSERRRLVLASPPLSA